MIPSPVRYLAFAANQASNVVFGVQPSRSLARSGLAIIGSLVGLNSRKGVSGRARYP